MKRKTIVVSAVVLVLLALVAGAAANQSLPWWHDFTEEPRSYSQTEYAVVVFDDPPAASYVGDINGLAPTKPARGEKLDPNSPAVRAYVDHLTAKHNDYRVYLSDKARRAEVVRDYVLAGNALAIRLNGTRLQTLQQGPGVRYVAYSGLYQPTMNVSVGLIGASDLWPAAGGQANAGAGVKVGVIDSGIDNTHRFFACKDEIPQKVYASGAAFDPSNVLVNDHGTHVAGTIGGCVIEPADGPIIEEISGVAPAAELWDYNVFPGFGAGYVAFGGSAFSHDIAAAIEDAVADGMDVINMSLGGGVQGPHDFLAEATNAAVDAGLVAAVAAGNSGPGDATVLSPGNAANALTAGASTNPHFIGISVVVGSSEYGAALGDFKNFVPAITAAYTVTNPANGCSAISADLSGQIALIDRGVCTFTTKIRNAEAAGAAGVLVANNVAGDPVAMGHDGTDPFPTIPAAMVSKNDGEAMKPSGTATVDGTVITEFVTDNADIIAGFSSRGPTPFTYLIKPDVTAPGVNVYSSVFDDKFAMFQGTSMASPHLAGAAALLIELHPKWSPFDVKSAIVNTAERPVTDHVTGTADAGVLARGNGRVNVSLADATPVTFDPVSVSYGYWSGNKPVAADFTLTLYDADGTGASCSVVSVTGQYVTPSADQVLIPAGGSSSLILSLDAGRSDTTVTGDYGGDVAFSCDGTPLVVPWWVRINRQAP
jgi:minor extracellular serine protease Vpr